MQEDFEVFKKKVEKAYAKIWGKRCEVKDLDDFPELKTDPANSRCACCYAYELLDKNLDNLWADTQKWFGEERDSQKAL